MAELVVSIARELRFLQKKKNRGDICRVKLGRRASVKDMVESLGVPHTEVGRLVIDGKDVDFSFIPESGGFLQVYSIMPPFDPTVPSMLRPSPLQGIRFAVDANVGKLAMLLRASGFDTWFEKGCSDYRLAMIAHKQQRIVLTKDVQLLKRSIIEFGKYVDSVFPDDQLMEIFHFFGISKGVKVFTRCLLCNTLLEKVAKESILERLEPKTKKYYNSFSRCTSCDKIYFKGSHFEKIRQRLEKLGVESL